MDLVLFNEISAPVVAFRVPNKNVDLPTPYSVTFVLWGLQNATPGVRHRIADVSEDSVASKNKKTNSMV
jgi:hypothetical protein